MHYLSPKADKSTDILKQNNLMARDNLSATLSDVKTVLANNREEYCVFPVCKPGYESSFLVDDSASGNWLFIGLYNLAEQMNDWDNKILYNRLNI